MASADPTSPTLALSLDTSQRPFDHARARSNTVANDRSSSGSSTSYSSLLPLPATVSPDPAFIAPSAASQIVTNDHDHHADVWLEYYGMEPCGETALVADGALKAVNGFLDQLLFSFITKAEATSLAALRPAVAEVLKPRLAKDAIAGADQELRDYLGSGDDEALLNFHARSEPAGDWNAERVWKRTRLRCMVYSSLGDMEEDEEDRHVREQQLDGAPTSRRYSTPSFVVSPAVAIFLTSVLECIGEQALVFAGQQAYHRVRAIRENEQKDGGGPSSPVDIAERTVVEECDTDKVALDRTLGRLWRAWRKSLRSPSSAVLPRSRDSFRSRDRSRTNSSSGSTPIGRDTRRQSVLEVMDQDAAAAMPLPMSEDDVREIEVPGLVYYADEETISTTRKIRPKSMLMSSRIWEDVLTPDDSMPQSPQSPIVQFVDWRKRSNSLPTPIPSPYEKVFRGRDETSLDAAVAAEVDKNIEKDEKSQSVAEIHPVTPGILSPKSLGEVKQLPAEANDNHPAVNIAPAGNTSVEDDAQEDRPLSKDSDVAERYFVERPTIMTSHRVSLGAAAPDDPLSPRPASVRSPSVHSIRLIDVPSRSPGRSHHGSVEATSPGSRSPSSPFARNASNASGLSRERTSTESIAEEPDFSSAAGSRVVRKSKSREFGNAAPMQGGVQARGDPPIFVLAPAPATQRRVSSDAGIPESPIRHKMYDTLPVLKGDSSGVPPLTPLREMMEGAADTSDEASSIGNSSRSASETRVMGHTPNISVASITQPPRSEQHRRPVPTTNGSAHRARKDSLKKPSSEFLNRSKRSPSQSSSATTYSNKLKPMRTSSDYGEDGNAKGQSFEQLIRSDQTIQYTLTPQNMREIESPDSPQVANPPKVLSESPRVSTPPRSSSTPPRTNAAKTTPPSVSKQTSLHSNPPSEFQMPKTFQPIPRPVSNNASRIRPGAPQARDARVDRESIGDFADFIRSTGPPGLSRPATRASAAPSARGGRSGLTRNASASFSRAASAAPIRRSESSAGRTRLMAREAVVPHSDNNSDLIDFIRQGPPSENTHDNPRIPRTVAPFRSTMDSDQMTGAVGGISGIASSSGRGYESVLPEARNSLTSTNVPESMHSSVNSQSALLGTHRKALVSARSYADLEEEEDVMPKRKTRRVLDPYAIDFSDEEEEELFAMSHKKPQRQEESLMDFLNNVPPPPSSTIAPPEPSPKSKSLLVKKKPSRGLISRFSRSASSNNIMADISTPIISGPIPRVSSGSRPATHTPQIPPPPQAPFLPRSATSPPPQAILSARTGTSHSFSSSIKPPPRQISQPNINNYSHPGPPRPPPPQYQAEKPASYQPARTNYVSQLDTERKPLSTAGTNGNGRGGVVRQQSYQPREARQRSEGTNDLAAFLKASGPPAHVVESSRPEPFLLRSELPGVENGSVGSGGGGGGGFSRMFGRKKKAVGGYA